MVGETAFTLSIPEAGSCMAQNLYKQVQDVPSPVDLAIVIVPAEAVPDVIKEVGETGHQKCHY